MIILLPIMFCILLVANILLDDKMQLNVEYKWWDKGNKKELITFTIIETLLAILIILAINGTGY